MRACVRKAERFIPYARALVQFPASHTFQTLLDLYFLVIVFANCCRAAPSSRLENRARRLVVNSNQTAQTVPQVMNNRRIPLGALLLLLSAMAAPPPLVAQAIQTPVVVSVVDAAGGPVPEPG